LFDEDFAGAQWAGDGTHVIDDVLAALFIGDNEIAGFGDGNEVVAFACWYSVSIERSST